MAERVFVFQIDQSAKDSSRPRLIAFPESKILTIESQRGSENCYLMINGHQVVGSFDAFVKSFGKRMNVTNTDVV